MDQFIFIKDICPNGNISEGIRFALEMLRILLDRGFYCKLIDCPNVVKMSDKPLIKPDCKTDNGNHNIKKYTEKTDREV